MHDYREGWGHAGELPEKQLQDIETKFSTRLEKVMDVEAFLRYLAISVIVGNEDTVLRFPRNYFLALPYGSKKLIWVTWDLDCSFDSLGLLMSPDALNQSIRKPSELPQIARIVSVRKYEKRYLEILKELMQGPCRTDRLVAHLETAQRTTKDAIAEESERPAIVMKAGKLGGPSRPGFLGDLGKTGHPDLIDFVKSRGKWVTERLAAEGFAVEQTNDNRPRERKAVPR